MIDGDVNISSRAIPFLINKFKDSSVGAVTGRPISLEPKNLMLGFWSHLLTDSSQYKGKEDKRRKNGYLFMLPL